MAAQTDLDETIRRDAAVRLQALTDSRQAQLALEGALMGGGLSPCVAVVTGHSVTVVTACPQPTEQDEAMLLELAAVHAQARPQDVRLICAEQLDDQ